MPELPEIKAHAERLTRSYSRAVLDRFEPISFTALKTATPDPSAAVGLELSEVTNRGKHLLIRFRSPHADPSGVNADSGTEITFVVHLMQGGRLVPDAKLSARPRNGIARWRFSEVPSGADPALLLTEAGREHKAGVWVFEGDPTLTEPAPAPFDGLGPDADEVNLDQFTTALAAKNQRVHGFLRDQHGVAGLGRMLANEICHRAKLSPFAMTARLSDAEVDALYTAMGEAIADGLTFERSRDSMSRSADRPGAVHRRKGETCPTCGDTIRAVEYNAYEVDYCPSCQTEGKVLADNTTSKFLK
ncbi:MAG: DNA-formamidopyrimidine glycosylase family protein [Microthrixaceae bacterium]